MLSKNTNSLGYPAKAVPVIIVPSALCAVLVRQHGVDDALVQAQLTAIRGNLEHIVNGGIYIAAAC